MKIGIPTEVKIHEYRVGMVPSSVREVIKHGHSVTVQSGAGNGIGITDADYQAVGAKIAATADEIFAEADMIVKVKEPQPAECKQLRQDQVLFTFLHLAADLKQIELLQESGCVAIAYETVTDKQGGLPLLAPMSEVAGRISVQVGAHYLQKGQQAAVPAEHVVDAGSSYVPSNSEQEISSIPFTVATAGQQGRGILLGGVPGVEAGNVVVVGGGVVGSNAIKLALGMGANVTVLDKSLPRLRELEAMFGSQLKTLVATEDSFNLVIPKADLLIGAVLVPGAEAPKVISKKLVASMQPGSVVVDVAIDQGGCLETSKATNFMQPIYIESGVIHCCVTNLPGIVPRTSAFALNNATLPFIVELANKGHKAALLGNQHLLAGLNIYNGHVTHPAVAHACGQSYRLPREILV